MRLGDANLTRMLGPGDLTAPNDPQNAVDGCEHDEDDFCRRCDPDAYADGSDGYD